jgi:hypothetical protein
LKVLGDLAKPIDWNESRQQTYSREVDRLRAEGHKVNGYLLTGIMLAKEVQNVDVVAAYHSGESFEGDFPVETEAGKQARLGHLLGLRFAVPKGDPEEALKKAVTVAKLPEFQEHRLSMYDWQEKMVDKSVPLEEAVARMGEMLSKYNACVEKAVKGTYQKLGFTVFGTALSVASQNPLAAAGALVTMVRFAKLEKKPTLFPGLNGPAAMFHDFDNAQKPFWDWTKHS